MKIKNLRILGITRLDGVRNDGSREEVEYILEAIEENK